jgi:gp16 family phage-associated protein
MASPEQIKQRFKQQGLTFTQWAKDNDFPVNKVHRVMAGIEKGNYGKAHEIAVKLGLKPDPSKTTA